MGSIPGPDRSVSSGRCWQQAATIMDQDLCHMIWALIALSAAAASAEIRDDNLVAQVFQFSCLQKWGSTDNFVVNYFCLET